MRMVEAAEVVPSLASVLGGTVIKAGAGYLVISQAGAAVTAPRRERPPLGGRFRQGRV